MIRKLACAVTVMVAAVGFVMADEYAAVVTKVDGNKITLCKTKKVGKKTEKGEEMVVEAASDATVAKGTFNKDTKKVEKGDAIEGGVKGLRKLVTDAGEKGVNVRVTTDDTSKKATQILITGGKKKAAAE
jgi:hypothetical protein